MSSPLIILPNSTLQGAGGAFDYIPGQDLGVVEQAAIQTFVDRTKLDYIAAFYSPETQQSLFRNYEHVLPIKISHADRQQLFLGRPDVEQAAMDALLHALRNEATVKSYLEENNLRLTLETTPNQVPVLRISAA